jgi:tagatose-1,6-bisphosphate aldolase non-catalytic subunit AgaZ/GatZ
MKNVPVQAIFTGKNQWTRIKGANLIWKFADDKVNVFGPAHIEKSHFKGVFGCQGEPVQIVSRDRVAVEVLKARARVFI